MPSAWGLALYIRDKSGWLYRVKGLEVIGERIVRCW